MNAPAPVEFMPSSMHLGGWLHRLHTSRSESGRETIVAAHGFGSDGPASFSRVARHLAPIGIDLVAPDLLGFGASDKPAADESTYSLKEYADRLHAVTTRLSLDKPVLLGHSFGGKIAMATAATYPESYSGLVLINCGGFSFREKILAALGRSKLVHVLLRSNRFRSSVLTATPLRPLIDHPERIAELDRLRKSLSKLELDSDGTLARIRALEMETLILWGTNDTLLSSSTPNRIRNHIPHAKTQYLASGHAPMISDAKTVAFAVAAFLQTRVVTSADNERPEST